MCLDTNADGLNMVDEHGNIWSCTLKFLHGNNAHFEIGGRWNTMIKARRLKEGARVVIGAPGVGMNGTVYFVVIRR